MKLFLLVAFNSILLYHPTLSDQNLVFTLDKKTKTIKVNTVVLNK